METHNSKRNNIYFLTPILFLFFFSFLYLISSLFNKTFNKPKNSLFVISKELNTINNNLVKKIDNNFEDVESLTSVFKESISSLNSLLNVVETHYNEDPEYKNLILTSISSNISFYDECIETLNNRSELNSSYELDNFSSLKSSCITNYNNLLAIFDLDFDFPSKMDKTFDSYYLSLNLLIKENRDRAFKEKQEKAFLKDMESLNHSLPSMNEDLMPAILRIRDEKRSLSVILDDIQIKEEKLLGLKSNLISLSLPEGYTNFYTSFLEYLNLYNIYLDNIKSAVILEYSSKNYEDSSKEIDKHYKNASSKRKDLLKAYDSYINLFNN